MKRVESGAAAFILLFALSSTFGSFQLLTSLYSKYGRTTVQLEGSKNIITLRPVEMPQHTIILPEEKDSSHGHHHHSSIDVATASKRQKKTKVQTPPIPKCPSHYQNENNRNEHSPLVFKKDNLLVCRSPKVGSNELRSVATAYETDSKFIPPTVNEPYHGSILANIKNVDLFHHYLYDSNVTRIMFVRHPVHRLLSAFIQTARGRLFWKLHGFSKNLKASPKTFRKWINNRDLFFKYYSGTCHANSTELNTHFKIQHWAPPQHCRCGLHDCEVNWKIYKIEQHSVQSVLKDYLPQKYLPPANATEILHTRKYTKKDYLTKDILDFLNYVTKEEQAFFGYKPLTINDI